MRRVSVMRFLVADRLDTFACRLVITGLNRGPYCKLLISSSLSGSGNCNFNILGYPRRV
jgi:hypothetical protein